MCINMIQIKMLSCLELKDQISYILIKKKTIKYYEKVKVMIGSCSWTQAAAILNPSQLNVI